LKIQGKELKGNFQCNYCDSCFTRKHLLEYHTRSCKISKYQVKISEEKDIIIENQKEKIKKLEKALELCKKELEIIKEYNYNYRKDYQQCALEAIQNQKDENKAKEIRVKYLEKKYLKKQQRVKYHESNVIYVITTPSLKKDRRYILGKATNLTNRLSTYNKTDEHEVVFYSSCPSKEKMSLVEGLVFNNLSECRERANRERFILPENENIDYFSNIIKKCIDFIK